MRSINDVVSEVFEFLENAPPGVSASFRPYFESFNRFTSFCDVEDRALRALYDNVHAIPVSASRVAAKSTLLQFLETLSVARMDATRVKDDLVLPPLLRRPYDTTESYVQRVVVTAPNVPPQFAADVLFRHNSQYLDEFASLKLDQFNFATEQWPVERVITEVAHRNPQGVAIEIERFREFGGFPPAGSLAGRMVELKTWPVALPVFHNTAELKDESGRRLARWEAIDGMHRLGYLRAMQELHVPLLPTHEVCVARSAG